MRSFFSRLLGDSNDRELQDINPIVTEINELEPEFEAMSQEEIRQLIADMREEYEDDDDLEDFLPQVFAAVREAAKRTRGQRPYDVQLMGGIALR
jgi:preprotein translocase subunit SecA